MRRDLLMPGQPYRLGDRIVVVEIVHRDGRVVLADGTVTTARCLARTPDRNPGSRTSSEPWRILCASCGAPEYARCRTADGRATGYHACRMSQGRVGRMIPVEDVRSPADIRS